MISVSRIATASVTRRPKSTGYKALLLASALLFVGACEDDTPADPVVIGSIAVTPRLSTARVGATQQLEAAAFGPTGSPMAGETFTWTSSEPTVATVSATGLVTYVGSGSTAILAKARGVSGFATIVSEANVATVSITAPNLILPSGQTRTIYATPLDANGVSQFRPVTWTSSAPTIATVNGGVITAVSAGNATITATSEGKSASVVFTILPPAPVHTVTLTPGFGTLQVGGTIQITNVLRDVDNGVLSNRVINWTTSNAAVATVSQAGVITAVGAGIVTITATSEGKSGTTTFGVTTDPGLMTGVPVTFTNTATGTSRWYAVYVPVGATELNVTLRQGNGDPDLYTYPPGSNSPNCSSETGGTTIAENCVTANPAPGIWFVEIYAWAAHTGTVLTATITK